MESKQIEQLKALLEKQLNQSRKKEGVLTVEDLIQEVAALCDLDEEQAKRTVYAIFLTIERALQRKEDVRIGGFGTFWVNKRKPFRVVVPNRGLDYMHPGDYRVMFRAHRYARYLMNPDEYEKKEE